MASFLEFLNPLRPFETVRSVALDFERMEERSSAIVPPPRSATSGVTTSDALSMASVYRAISILSTAIKQVGVHIYRDDEKLESTPLWIKQPDDKITRAEFMARTVNSIALAGNCFWLVSRNARGETVKLEVLNPFDMLIQSDDYGNLLGYTYRGTIEYSIRDIQHLKALSVPGNLYGLGPIQSCQPELLAIKDTRDYAATWFTDSAIPSGVLKSDQMLSPDQATAAKNAWNTTAGAKNGVAVLGNGLTYMPMYLNPKDAQFLENQAFGVQQVARLFGIPSQMLIVESGSSMTYSNVESEQIAFTRYTLSQYYVEIEAAMSSLLPRGTEARMNIDALLRADTLTRYQAHQIALGAGFKTLDEVRRDEKLPPLGVVPIV
jgi:HK97 family phage portal protein